MFLFILCLVDFAVRLVVLKVLFAAWFLIVDCVAWCCDLVDA